MASSKKFMHKPSANISPDLLASALGNAPATSPTLHRYDIPDFMYSQVRFESRPNREELLIYEPLMLELNLYCEGRRYSQKQMETAWNDTYLK
eukprot:14962704-Alexandrium_andersonii.AAC.1